MRSEPPEGWARKPLVDLVALQRGHDLPTSTRRVGTVPVMGSAGRSGFHDTVKAPGPGLVIGRSGASIGKVHWCAEDYWPLNTALYVTNFGGNDPRFVYLALRELDLASFNSGSAQPSLNRNYIAQIPMLVPSHAEQLRIAAVHDALDHKIESNTAVAAALRALLLLIADSAGVETALDRVAAFRNGGALTRLADGEGRPILRIKELRAGVSGDTPRMSGDVRAEHEVQFGDLLFSWSGTLLVNRWDGEDSVLNQHVFRVDPVDGVPTWLVEAWIEGHLPSFRSTAADKATTMGHIQRHHLTEALVRMPSAERLRLLVENYSGLDQLRMGLLRERRQLRALRDALLPKLITGQIRVPDAEEQGDGGAVEESAA